MATANKKEKKRHPMTMSKASSAGVPKKRSSMKHLAQIIKRVPLQKKFSDVHCGKFFSAISELESVSEGSDNEVIEEE
jgi:uncharacterized protein YegL